MRRKIAQPRTTCDRTDTASKPPASDCASGRTRYESRKLERTARSAAHNQGLPRRSTAPSFGKVGPGRHMSGRFPARGPVCDRRPVDDVVKAQVSSRILSRALSDRRSGQGFRWPHRNLQGAHQLHRRGASELAKRRVGVRLGEDEDPAIRMAHSSPRCSRA